MTTKLAFDLERLRSYRNACKSLAGGGSPASLRSALERGVSAFAEKHGAEQADAASPLFALYRASLEAAVLRN